MGCRLSDHGLNHVYADDCTEAEAARIFADARSGKKVSLADANKFRSFMLLFVGELYAARGWVMQLHLGALRNNNTRLMRTLGADTGFDSIGDWPQAEALARYLDRLDSTNRLPKTILYNLNPADNYAFATMLGNFQDGSVPGKIQFGSGWWFLDQKEGMDMADQRAVQPRPAQPVRRHADRLALFPELFAARILPPSALQPHRPRRRQRRTAARHETARHDGPQHLLRQREELLRPRSGKGLETDGDTPATEPKVFFT